MGYDSVNRRIKLTMIAAAIINTEININTDQPVIVKCHGAGRIKEAYQVRKCIALSVMPGIGTAERQQLSVGTSRH